MNESKVAIDPEPQRLFEIEDATSDVPTSTLRGARTEANSARVGRILRDSVLVVVAASAIAFFVVGAHKNAQINQLRQHGTPVELTITGCVGLMGGSGSSGAGYACNGTFRLDGRLFDEPVPGNVLYRPGAKVAAIAATNGSGLFAPVAVLADEHASWSVFIVPVVLALAFFALSGAVLVRRRQFHQDR